MSNTIKSGMSIHSKPHPHHSDVAVPDVLKPFLRQVMDINHELSNPLSGIIGYTEFLLEESDKLSEDHSEYVRQVLACAERMVRILDEFNRSKDTLEEQVDLRKIVSE